jgi:hypothetical protein
MKQFSADKNLLRRYLLGEIGQEERRALEEFLMTADEAYDEVLAAERELTDDYLDGALTPREKELFETDFLCTPERQQNLSFARTLKKYVNDAAEAEDASREQGISSTPSRARVPPPSTFPQSLRSRFVLIPALSLIVIAVAGLLVFRVWQNSRAVQQPVLVERRDNGQTGVFTIALTPVLVRDPGAWKRVTIPGDARTVRLRLEDVGADEYPGYQVVLSDTRSGDELFKGSDIKSVTIDGAKAVEFDVSAGLMRSGDFSVRLSGEKTGDEPEELNTYHFRITRP